MPRALIAIDLVLQKKFMGENNKRKHLLHHNPFTFIMMQKLCSREKLMRMFCSDNMNYDGLSLAYSSRCTKAIIAFF